jgi:hypothetical protein
MSLSVSTGTKKRPLSASPQQHAAASYQPAATTTCGGGRLSPTLSFKRLRVSEPSSLPAPAAQLLPVHEPQKVPYEGGKFYGSEGEPPAAAAPSSRAAEPPADNWYLSCYEPVNHLLGDLHRERLLRNERDASSRTPPPRGGGAPLASSSFSGPTPTASSRLDQGTPASDMSFEHHGSTPPRPVPAASSYSSSASPALVVRRSHRPLRLCTDSKLS